MTLGRFLGLWLPLAVGLGLWAWSRRRWRRSRRRWRRRVLRLAALLRLVRLFGWLPVLGVFLVLGVSVSAAPVPPVGTAVYVGEPTSTPVFRPTLTPSPAASLPGSTVPFQEPTSTTFLGPTLTPSPAVTFNPGPTEMPGSGNGSPPWAVTPGPDQWIPGVNCINATSTPVGYVFPTFVVTPVSFSSPTPGGVQVTPCWNDACITGGWTGATPECCQFGLTATPTPTPEFMPSDVGYAGCVLIECYEQLAGECNPESLEWCRVWRGDSWDGERTTSENTGAYCRSGDVDQVVDGVFVDLVGEHASFDLVLSAVESFTNTCEAGSGGQQWIGDVTASGGSTSCGGPGRDTQELVIPFSGTGQCTVESTVELIRRNPGCPPFDSLCCDHASAAWYTRMRRSSDGSNQLIHTTGTQTEPGTWTLGPDEITGDLYDAIVVMSGWYGLTPGDMVGQAVVTCGDSVTVVEVGVNVVEAAAIHYVCVDSPGVEVWAVSDYTLDVTEYDAAYKPPVSEGSGWLAWPWNLESGYFERLWSSADPQPLESFAADFGADVEHCFEISQQVQPPGDLKSRDWRYYPDERPVLPGVGRVDKFPWAFLVCRQGTERVPGYSVPPGCVAPSELPLCPGSSNPIENVVEIIPGDCYVFLPEFDFSVNLSWLGFGEVGIDTPGVQVCVDYVRVNHSLAGWNFGDIFSTVTLAAVAGVIIKLFRDA